MPILLQILLWAVALAIFIVSIAGMPDDLRKWNGWIGMGTAEYGINGMVNYDFSQQK